MKKQKLNKRRYLGDLCKHGHAYHAYKYQPKRTMALSVRYKGCNTCCVCNAISVEKRKKEQKKYRDTHKEKMKKYQKNYRMAHGKDYRADYHHAYYMNVTKQILQSEREHHNKKLSKSDYNFLQEVLKKAAIACDIPIKLIEK